MLVLDRLRLVVEPKMALTGDQLVRWLCYALGTLVPHQAAMRRWDTDRHGCADVTTTANLAPARVLADTSTAFPKDSTPNASLCTLGRARYPRLNTRYRPASTWVGLILRGAGRYGERSASAADVYQLLTYIAGYGPSEDPRSAIVHPSPEGPCH
ncbi:hypothetical protein ACFVUN_01690 [Kitasatospora griseola]|uniref:hypothetical protein n=1 Tax=Kitasatospora griseola TaxID=2064 RepID=UPI0036DB5D49